MKMLKLFSLLALASSLLGCSQVGDKSPTGTVTVQDIEQRISINGTLRGKRYAYITPLYIGYVRDLRVKLGDKVQGGEPLVRISQALDQPLSQVFPIRAPFSGVITQILRREGEFINETSGATEVTRGSILRIDDISEYWLDSAVPETDIAKIKVGLNSEIRPNALPGTIYSGTVDQISLSSKESADRWDRGKVEFPISIRVNNPDQNLRPGMSASVDIVAATAENVLTLPHEYVHRRENQYYVITKSGEEVIVEVGLSNESLVQITKGLEDGQKVKMIDFSQVSSDGKLKTLTR